MRVFESRSNVTENNSTDRTSHDTDKRTNVSALVAPLRTPSTLNARAQPIKRTCEREPRLRNTVAVLRAKLETIHRARLGESDRRTPARDSVDRWEAARSILDIHRRRSVPIRDMTLHPSDTAITSETGDFFQALSAGLIYFFPHLTAVRFDFLFLIGFQHFFILFFFFHFKYLASRLS